MPPLPLLTMRSTESFGRIFYSYILSRLGWCLTSFEWSSTSYKDHYLVFTKRYSSFHQGIHRHSFWISQARSMSPLTAYILRVDKLRESSERIGFALHVTSKRLSLTSSLFSNARSIHPCSNAPWLPQNQVALHFHLPKSIIGSIQLPCLTKSRDLVPGGHGNELSNKRIKRSTHAWISSSLSQGYSPLDVEARIPKAFESKSPHQGLPAFKLHCLWTFIQAPQISNRTLVPC